MTFVLGLTGSIGMGKTTTAQMFADAGIPVWNADAVVHELYDVGGAAAAELGAHYPDVITNGAVDRAKLREKIAETPAVLDHVQSIVHPLVAAHRGAFLKNTTAETAVLDVPLLFETGADTLCDAVAVVSVAPDEQKRRVLARGEMSEDDFALILSRQMPDAEKRERARWVINTQTLDGAKQAVHDILAEIAKEADHA